MLPHTTVGNGNQFERGNSQPLNQVNKKLRSVEQVTHLNKSYGTTISTHPYLLTKKPIVNINKERRLQRFQQNLCKCKSVNCPMSIQ